MRNIIGVILFLFLSITVHSQNYWQQNADYKIEVDVNERNNTYKGNQEIVYKNNSRDTLNKIFFHLYFNAFKVGSDMAVRLKNGDDINTRFDVDISELKADEEGFLNVTNLKQDDLKVETYLSDTILEVILAKPLEPGDSSIFTMDFNGQVPVTIRRAGRDSPMGVKFSMAQWYPKISEYDYEGWNTAPYTGREFHGVWGDFDVTIKIDEDYIVAASYSGNDKTPDWFYNLSSNNLFITINNKRFQASYELIGSSEKEFFWNLLDEVYPTFQMYRNRTDRDIPLIKFSKVEAL